MRVSTAPLGGCPAMNLKSFWDSGLMGVATHEKGSTRRSPSRRYSARFGTPPPGATSPRRRHFVFATEQRYRSPCVRSAGRRTYVWLTDHCTACVCVCVCVRACVRAFFVWCVVMCVCVWWMGCACVVPRITACGAVLARRSSRLWIRRQGVRTRRLFRL